MKKFLFKKESKLIVKDIDEDEKITWYCDKCGCVMNDQIGFDTSTGLWTCAECGFENDVSTDNIRKKFVHVFLCESLTSKRTKDFVWFDSYFYSKEDCENKFIKCDEDEFGNPASYYLFEGEKYSKVEYFGEEDYDNFSKNVLKKDANNI